MLLDLPVYPQERSIPRSLLVRYGAMRSLAELAWEGQARPVCGQRVVISTRRGVDLAEVVSTTCDSSGCGRWVSREAMVRYIEQSGGDGYPFTNEGRVLRMATGEDLARQAELDARKGEFATAMREAAAAEGLEMRLVEVELPLGGDSVTFHFRSEGRVDFRNLVRTLSGTFRMRVVFHQVNARDEARLVADFETCGRQCCCREFLKVLKPVSMLAARVQKETFDPGKISGRCGRLKCCLRYEEATYDELRLRLPRNGTRVRVDGQEGVVESSAILAQVVRVRLRGASADEVRWVAANVDEIEVLDDDGGDERAGRRPRRQPPRR